MYKMIGIILFVFSGALFAFQPSVDQTAAIHFDKIKNDPEHLLLFLQNMPKGGDLHFHLAGSGMAENMIQYAQSDGLCVDKNSFIAAQNSDCAPDLLLENSTKHSALYNQIINSWSMRNFVAGSESGHDHFFATFEKFNAVSSKHTSEILAEVMRRAFDQNESYLELMVTPDHNDSGMLGKKVGWNPDLKIMREKLLANDLNSIVNEIIKNTDTNETEAKKILNCDPAAPICKIKVKYLYQILREQPPEQVFGQLLAGFEVASKDPRFVGINMVQPEDGFISMRDYKLHMQMVGFLHELYPNVHISLHAGELSSTLVPYAGLQFHINDAVRVAHADRIGHGIDVAYEKNSAALLNDMAKKQVMVEINLTSNAEILRIEGDKHPLPLYLKFNVPVALSTDDEGVLRTNLTEQYQRAILTYHFSYPFIKNLVRNSIYYSFIPGKNLWNNEKYTAMNVACAKDSVSVNALSTSCQTFLKANEKAESQWDLEKRFFEFEKEFKRTN